MATELLPDELWHEIEPLLPPPPPRTPAGGRPPADNRSALRGILFVTRTGIPWQMLPTEVFERQRLLLLETAAGLDAPGHLARVATAAAEPTWQGRGREPRPRRDRQPVRAGAKGGPHTGPSPVDRAKPGCKRHVLTDADGVPLVVQTTAANVNDETQLKPLLEAMPAVRGPRGRPRQKPGIIFGDRAYRDGVPDRLGDGHGDLLASWPHGTTRPTAAGWACSATWWNGR